MPNLTLNDKMKKRTTPAIATTLVLLMSAAPISRATSQSNQLWRDVDERSLDQTAKRLLIPKAYRTTRLDPVALNETLAAAPMEFARPPNQNPMISLPMPDGTLARFRFEEAPIMEPGLAAKFPSFKTYRAQGIDDPNATSRFDFLPTGFHAIVLSPSGTVLIDPYAQGNITDYISYWKRDAANCAGPFQCDFVDPALPSSQERTAAAPTIISGGTLRTYRLALAASSSYSAVAGGGTIAGALAAQILVMNRVNGVYERDVAIRMTLISNNNLIIYTDAATDPYAGAGNILDINQANIDAVIGPANYDIGHVFNVGTGGIAQLNVPCTASKARGATGLANPVGDPFAIDYVAHEMGHQWGASHTFNGTSGNCGGNRSGAHAYEPGSGITIMAYAGICGNQNLAAHSIDTFHYDSLNAIIQYSQSGNGNSCAVQTAAGNTPPSITGPGNFNIPKQTAFSLTALASDIDNDSITYDWQEFDLGPSTSAVPNTDADGQPRPILRPYLPNSSPTRTFPSLQYILDNANVPPATTDGFLTGELLPAITRTMVFQVIARDNRANAGGINSATSNVFVTASSGPFTVTVPDTAVAWTGGSTENVTWNVSNTTAAPVSAANVKISLSVDGGSTFPLTLLASTPNDGSAAVTVPHVETTTARIKIEAVGNVFFDISAANFTIHPGAGSTPIPTPTPTPTPIPTISISGTVIYCPNPAVHPLSGVTVTLTGSTGGSILSNAAGDYLFAGLLSGGNYTVTPTKDPLLPGSAGINTVDVLATQRHFLAIVALPPGCRLSAADANGDTTINTVDVIAIQRFFLGASSGIANVGNYIFSPASRNYPGVTISQANQDYDAIVVGDTASAFVHRPDTEPPEPVSH